MYIQESNGKLQCDTTDLLTVIQKGLRALADEEKQDRLNGLATWANHEEIQVNIYPIIVLLEEAQKHHQLVELSLY